MNKVRVIIADECVYVYPEGGMSFHFKEQFPIGWTVCDEPSPEIQRAAIAIRAAMFPNLPALSLADIMELEVVGRSPMQGAINAIQDAKKIAELHQVVCSYCGESWRDDHPDMPGAVIWCGTCDRDNYDCGCTDRNCAVHYGCTDCPNAGSVKRDGTLICKDCANQ